MNGMVEIRLHGREADVAEMVTWLESLGARFGGRIYQDRGGTGEVRAYGKVYGDELRMPAVEVVAEVESQEKIAADRGNHRPSDGNRPARAEDGRYCGDWV